MFAPEPHGPVGPQPTGMPPAREQPLQASRIRVYAVDDHFIFRHGLAALVGAQFDMQWAGEAASGAEAVREAPSLAPDVVLVDLVMPEPDGIATLAALRPLLPHARFVGVSCTPSADQARRAIAAGAACLILKSATAQEFVTLIHAASKGRSLHSPELLDLMARAEGAAALGSDLTRRERSLLVLMARGMPNQAISQRLKIGVPTVKFHVTNILSKLQAENRTAAVLAALRLKLVVLD